MPVRSILISPKELLINEFPVFINIVHAEHHVIFPQFFEMQFLADLRVSELLPVFLITLVRTYFL